MIVCKVDRLAILVKRVEGNLGEEGEGEQKRKREIDGVVLTRRKKREVGHGFKTKMERCSVNPKRAVL
jgi:hypothetical protein